MDDQFNCVQIKAFENKSHGKLFWIKYPERKANAFVKHAIISIICNYEPLLQTIKRRKLNGKETYDGPPHNYNARRG